MVLLRDAFTIVMLLTLINQNFAAVWMVKPVNFTGRYENIYFPVSDYYMVQGTLFRENIIYAPKTYFIKPTKATAIDFCSDGRRELASGVPSIWNNTQVTSPCKAYFCDSIAPPLWSQNTSNEYIEVQNGWLANPDVLHKMAQNWCTLCTGSISEEFHLVLKNTTCPWFNATCDGYCPQDVPCVFFNNRNSLCYVSNNKYLTKADGFHFFFVTVRALAISWVFFVFNIICLLISLFCVILPEVKALKQVILSQELTRSQKWRAIFSLRNQAAFVESFMNVLYIIAGFLDVINFITVNITGYIIFVHFAGTVYGWTLLIILWRHIEKQSDTFGASETLSNGLKFAWLLLLVIGSIVTGAGVIILIINVIAVGKSWLIFPVIGMLTYTSILGIFLLLVSGGLIVVAIRVFFKLSPPNDPILMARYLFQLKLTRSIILFTSLTPITLYVAALAILQLFWPDIFSIYYNVAVHGPLYCFISILYSLLTVFTLIHRTNFENFWGPICCCSKKSPKK